MFKKHQFILKTLKKSGNIPLKDMLKHVYENSIHSCQGYGYIINRISKIDGIASLAITEHGMKALERLKNEKK